MVCEHDSQAGKPEVVGHVFGRHVVRREVVPYQDDDPSRAGLGWLLLLRWNQRASERHARKRGQLE